MNNNFLAWYNKYYENISNILVALASFVVSFSYLAFYSNLFSNPWLLILCVIIYWSSFFIALYIFNNFNFSDIKFIKIMQYISISFIIFLSVSCILIYLLYIFDLLGIVDCAGLEGTSTDNSNKDKKITLSASVETSTTALTNMVGNIVSNLGSAAAGGSVGASIVKSSPHLPVAGKIASGAIIAGLTAVSVNSALRGLNSVVNNHNLEDVIKNSPHSQDIPPSTKDSFDTGFVAISPLDKYDIDIDQFLPEGKTPLEILLESQLTLNFITLISIFLLFYIIFYKYILVYNIKLIKFIVGKIGNIKLIAWVENLTNSSADVQNRFNFLFFIFITCLTLIIICVNIVLSSYLVIYLPDFIEVHNFIKNK